MQTFNLFPVPVSKFHLGRDLTTEEFDFANQQVRVKNKNNRTSEDSYVLDREPMLEIRKFIEVCLAQYLEEIYAPKHEVSLRLTQSWFNYCSPGEGHHNHTHANSFVSGVFYVKADVVKDRITFSSGTYRALTVAPRQWNVYNSQSWWLPTGVGDLCLFPSDTGHFVGTVEHDERISLAFNTFPVGRLGVEGELTELYL